MMQTGRFIVVEGLEGAGKSTAMQIIKQHLETYVSDIVLTREPGGTRLGELVREFIKETVIGEVLDPRSELLMLYAARTQLLEEVIRPSLKRGAWVLSDRFELSSFAYQGGGRGLDMQMITNLSSFCLQGFKPDLIVFMDVDPEIGLLRVKNRGKSDRIEDESHKFFKQVYNGYKEVIHVQKNLICIDANLPIEDVHQSIIAQLNTYLSRWHG